MGKLMLTPEKSIESQNIIGADIMMMLDDVVASTLTDMDRIKEATDRTLRWADRCIAAHKKCPPRWTKDALAAAGIPLDDIFDWSEGAEELSDMPREGGGKEGKDGRRQA